MGFYIRDISQTDRKYFSTNSQLLVSEEYNPEEYTRIFRHVFVREGNNTRKVTVDKPKIYSHNDTLLICPVIQAGIIADFVRSRKINSLELLVPSNSSDKTIDNIINLVVLYYANREISVGILVDSKEYIESRKDYLDENGFYISKYIPEAIDPLFEEMDVELVRHFKKVNRINLDENEVCSNEGGIMPGSLKEKAYEVQESFKEKLIKYLNKSKKTNVEVYSKGGITRKLFSKVLSTKYNPKKETICCLIIGMELCLDDALDLLNAAGYTLSYSLQSDLIIRKHIIDKEFNIEIINKELDELGLTILGWKPRDEK